MFYKAASPATATTSSSSYTQTKVDVEPPLPSVHKNCIALDLSNSLLGE